MPADSGLDTSDPAGPPRRTPGWSTRQLRLVGIVTGALLVLGTTAGWLWLAGRSTSEAKEQPRPVAAVAWQRPAVGVSGLARRSGVRVTQVAVTGDGGLLDLRFEVLDPDIAATLHDPATPPALIDEESGLVVNQPFMGHAHKGLFRAGATYYYVFVNPRNWVQRGNRVTILLGNTQLEHVTVR